jgi:hypothetical protein
MYSVRMARTPTIKVKRIFLSHGMPVMEVEGLPLKTIGIDGALVEDEEGGAVGQVVGITLMKGKPIVITIKRVCPTQEK